MMRKNMTMGGGMMGGMMRGRMGSSSRMGMEDNCHCPMCGGHDYPGRGRQFLSKEERKEHLKEYLEELEAETKAVKELVEEK